MLSGNHDLLRRSSAPPGIVHRLDKNTSGILIAAKNSFSHQALVEQFAQRQVLKRYLAICVGTPSSQTVEGNIGRHPIHRKKMTLLKEAGKGKESLTQIVPLTNNNELSLVEAFPKTGRTHQIRVHLQSIGHPVLGDDLYGSDKMNKKYEIFHHLLHAESITLEHPTLKKQVTFQAPHPFLLNKYKLIY